MYLKFNALILLLLLFSCDNISLEGSENILADYKAAENQVVLVDKNFENGDIIFQTSTSSQSKAIQLATKSPYSHVGIIYIKDGQYWVFEAVEPVKLTKLEDWISRGVDQNYVVKRLKNSDTVLTTSALSKMLALGEELKGKHYDLYFEWSDDKMYCSELVWKIYKEAVGVELGALQQLKEFDITNPAVQEQLKERYKENIPMEEMVISPAAIFESGELKLVFSSN